MLDGPRAAFREENAESDMISGAEAHAEREPALASGGPVPSLSASPLPVLEELQDPDRSGDRQAPDGEASSGTEGDGLEGSSAEEDLSGSVPAQPEKGWKRLFGKAGSKKVFRKKGTDASGGPAEPLPGEGRRKLGPRGASQDFPPLQTIIEWIPDAREKDVIEHARSYIQDHFGSAENAWIAAAEFRDGWFFEIHEGGAGKSHLPDLLRALTEYPDQMVWLPSGSKLNRAITVSIEDGEPVTGILSEKDTRKVWESGAEPVQRSGKMKPALRKGERTLVAGILVALAGAAILTGSMVYSLGTVRMVNEIEPLEFDVLPYAQVQAFRNIPENQYLQRFEYRSELRRKDQDDGESVSGWQPTYGSVPLLRLSEQQEQEIREMIEENVRRSSIGGDDGSGAEVPAASAPAGTAAGEEGSGVPAEEDRAPEQEAGEDAAGSAGESAGENGE